MAKLAIYRGETLEREIELGPRTARIGRGDQNEIVLTDPAKSVSRFHAELRYEDGRYTIVDLNSQNGTWVAGKRVAQTVLEPGVPVVVGTYRLVFVGEAAPLVDAEKTMISGPAPAAAPPAAAPAAPRPVPPPAAPKPEPVAAPAPAPVAKKEEPKPAAPAAPPPAAKPAAAPPTPPPAAAPPTPPPPAPAAAKPAAPPPAPKPAAAPPPAPPKPVAPPPAAPKPVPPPAAAAKPPEPAKPAAAKPAGKGFPKVALLVLFVVLVLGAVAAGIFLWKPAGGGTPAPSPAAQAASPASTQPSSTQPAAAEQQQPATAPAEPPAAATRPKIEQPAVTRAESEPRAPKAPKAVPKEAAGEAAAAPVPSKKADRRRGGAEPAPAPARPRDLGAMLAQARSAMINGDYLTAVRNLEAIVKVDPKYQDAAQMLDMAKSGARNAAQLAVDSGAKAEMAGDYDTAIKQYEQAQQLDPGSQPAADAMRRVHGRMQADGEEAFKRAKQFDALGRSSDAITMYEKAIKLLPADHASAKTAKERLAALRGGE